MITVHCWMFRQVLPVQITNAPTHQHGQGSAEHANAHVSVGTWGDGGPSVSLHWSPLFAVQDYAKSRIYMTSVDTGWINDENPLEKASRVAEQNHFQTPLDEVQCPTVCLCVCVSVFIPACVCPCAQEDAAARVLDPVIASVNAAAADTTGKYVPPHGIFLKDYVETQW